MSRGPLFALPFVAAVALPVSAGAHAEEGEQVGREAAFERLGRLHATLERVPRVRGLVVKLLDGPVPAVFVRNDTGRRLAIRGSAGEPFLRIGPQGVHANVRSPTYYRAGRQTIRAVPARADRSAAPRWKRLSRQSAWAWLEYRARVPLRRVRTWALTRRAATARRWTTRLKLGHRILRLDGRTDWLPHPRPEASRAAPQRTASAAAPLAVVGSLLLAVALGAAGRARGAAAG